MERFTEFLAYAPYSVLLTGLALISFNSYSCAEESNPNNYWSLNDRDCTWTNAITSSSPAVTYSVIELPSRRDFWNYEVIVSDAPRRLALHIWKDELMQSNILLQSLRTT